MFENVNPNWFIIPLTAGFVGYMTNWLAIKMLFRPFKPRWYTLGWQGIIPRTRDKLAANVANVVADRLVTQEELNKTLSSDAVRSALENGIYWGIVNSGNDAARRAFSIQLGKYLDAFTAPIAESLINDKDVAHTLDTVAAGAVRKAVIALGGIRRSKLARYLNPVTSLDSAGSTREKIHFFIEQYVRNSLHSVLSSGKTLNDLFPDVINLEKTSKLLTAELTPLMAEFFARDDISERLSEILIQYKNEQFNDSVSDKMKLGAVNIFLGDDRIRELVKMKLPELSAKIVNDSSIQRSINNTVENKLKELMDTPLTKFAEKAGQDNYYMILHAVSRAAALKVLPEDLFTRLHKLIKGGGDDRTIAEILDEAGIDLPSLVPSTIGLSDFITSENMIDKVKSAVKHGAGTLSLEPLQISNLSVALSAWIIRLLMAIVPAALRFVNIKKLVEDKIKSLDLKDVEDMLFSFMSSHFKWINILGFVIGFIVGVGQVVFMNLINKA